MTYLLGEIGKPFIPGWDTAGEMLRPFVAELVLIATIVAVLLAPFFTRRANWVSGLVAVGGLVLALLSVLVSTRYLFWRTTQTLSFGTPLEFLLGGTLYLAELYAAEVSVKFFHNDAPCAASLRHYADIGINFYNPGTQLSLPAMQALSGDRLALLGNIPPRDVLAAGTPDDVAAAVRKLRAETKTQTRWMLSCGGGMPPAVSTANIRAFLDAAHYG